MSIGFIIFEIIDKDSLKYQGINTVLRARASISLLDIHLNIKVLTPMTLNRSLFTKLDIHLNIKVLTPLRKVVNADPKLDIHLNIKVSTPPKDWRKKPT